MATQSLLSVTDFDNILNDYFGRTVTHTPRTKSISNISGQESFVDGTPASIKCFFMKYNQPWVFDKVAQIEGGDAILLAKIADSVSKDDLITAEGEKYICQDIINVPGVFDSTTDPTFIYTVVNLFLYND